METSTNVPGQHDGNGKFARGNKLGKGNPHADKVAKLRGVMLRTISEGDIKKLTQKLLLMALEGDLKAAELLLSRLLGKPTSDSAAPTVAIQNNVSATMSVAERRAVTARIVERLRAGRAAEDVSVEDP